MSEPSLNYKKVSQKIINFLKKEFKARKKKAVILGVSGGIDSTATAFLCKRAGLDLYTVILPYRGKNTKASMDVIKALKIPKSRVIKVDIGPAVDAQIKELKKVVSLDNVGQGNIMARQRMIVQYALAKKIGGLVMGTENLSEYYLGYFTLHGDQACDISAISGLWKTQVRELARYLGVPEELVNKTPTAGLWEGQTDEGEFGFSYQDADQIMYLSIIKKLPKEKIVKKGFSLKLINKVLERVKNNEYKRQNPPKLLI